MIRTRRSTKRPNGQSTQLVPSTERDCHGPIFTPPASRSNSSKSRGGAPAVDIVETDDAYEVTADLPGMDEKNLEVKLAKGTLTIKGEKREEKEEKKRDYYLRERHVGSFERRFALPARRRY